MSHTLSWSTTTKDLLSVTTYRTWDQQQSWTRWRPTLHNMHHESNMVSDTPSALRNSGHQQSKSLAENAVKQMKALLKKSKEQMDRWRRPLPNSPRFEEHPKRQDTRITSPRPDVQMCHRETSPWHQLFWNRKSGNQQQYQMRKIQIRKCLALCLYEVRWQPGLHWPTLLFFFFFFFISGKTTMSIQ